MWVETVGCEVGETGDGVRDEMRDEKREREQRTGAKTRLRTKDGCENEAP